MADQNKKKLATIIYFDDPQVWQGLFRKCSRLANRCVRDGKEAEARKYRLRAGRALIMRDKAIALENVMKGTRKRRKE